MSLREQLQRHYDQHGELEADGLVKAARRKTHPLHDYFDWNDTVAGQKWRLHQARMLICSVEIVYADPDTEEQGRVRAWHSVQVEGQSTFKPVEEIVDDPILTALLLRDMERDIVNLKKRYDRFKEFRSLVAKVILDAA